MDVLQDKIWVRAGTSSIIHLLCSDTQHFPSCSCFENFRIVARNLVVPPPIQLQATSRPNILMLLFDSMSRRKFDQMYMELTDTIHKQLAKKVTVFEFDRTSVFGMNVRLSSFAFNVDLSHSLICTLTHCISQART